MFEAKKWLVHFVRTLLTDYEDRLESHVQAFDANEVTLTNPAVSHITSVTVDSGESYAGYNWGFTTWGTTTAQTVLKASTGVKITEVVYEVGQPYCVLGYPKFDGRFPVASIDESFNRSSGGLGVNSPTSQSSDNIDYSFTVMLWGREGESYSGTSLQDHALVDEMVETVTNGIQEKGTGSPIPYPFRDLDVMNCSKIAYEMAVGAFHKDLTIAGKTKMDLLNSKW